MSFAEFNFTKGDEPAMTWQLKSCYETSLMMTDDARVTIPNWVLRELLKNYLSGKNLSDLTPKSYTILPPEGL